MEILRSIAVHVVAWGILLVSLYGLLFGKMPTVGTPRSERRRQENFEDLFK